MAENAPFCTENLKKIMLCVSEKWG